MKIFISLMLIGTVIGIQRDKLNLLKDYFLYKNIKYICYFSCECQYDNIKVGKTLSFINARTSVIQIKQNTVTTFEKALYQWSASVGVLLDGSCDNSAPVLEQISKAKLFDATHAWLVMAPEDKDLTHFIEQHFQKLNLSIDADVAVVGNDESGYTLTDVFNFGKIQGNGVETASLGSWRPDKGLNISLKGFKYYHRWNFHKLTLKAISVMARPEEFEPELLSGIRYTPGITAMTKIASQLLNILKEQHNFRFRYTIADRWIASPERNSTLGVTNSLLWCEQDIASTSARIFPLWLDWVDICFPPTTHMHTKFYYLMLHKGIGEYENRFLTPMSRGVWWSALAACALCAAVLAAAAGLEARPQPALYAFFSVSAALFQQDFDDGVQEKFTSQGRKMTLLVVGATSMLLYNYYTSSVVSWLLNAATPSIDTLDRLMASDLELIFEDIGYAREWLDNPGFFYFSGLVNPTEDKLREVKITKAKRTITPLQPLSVGFELMRTGSYAYHTEPYTASQAISRLYMDEELCSLGSLSMLVPSPVYIMVQKRSAYREFFTWSLMRLSERGHLAACRRRFAATMPACSGRKPRALALGQAAPAFLVLLQLAVLSAVILVAERVTYRVHPRHCQYKRKPRKPSLFH